MDLPTFTHEKKLLKKGFGVVAGMDEVGRGAGFGPLVVAVVALKDAKLSGLVNDSKLLTKERRVLLSEKIYQEALGVGLGVVSAREINKLGLSKALTLAGGRALENVSVKIEYLLLDGKHNFLNTEIPVEMLVKGDQKSISIASASIIAKVYRDNLIFRMSKKYPGYLLESNMGYATPAHKEKVKELGLSNEHRSNWGWEF